MAEDMIERVAREMLAAEYDATGEAFDEKTARRIRDGQSEVQIDYDLAIRAIIAALTQIERPWTPHLDYAGEPMEPGKFRDPLHP